MVDCECLDWLKMEKNIDEESYACFICFFFHFGDSGASQRGFMPLQTGKSNSSFKFYQNLPDMW